MKKKEYRKPVIVNRVSADGFIPALALAGGLLAGVGVGSLVRSDLRAKTITLKHCLI